VIEKRGVKKLSPFNLSEASIDDEIFDDDEIHLSFNNYILK
jgi:hypothetical protein